MPKRQKSHRFDILTIFPEMVPAYADLSILGRAQKKGVIEIIGHNLRDWTTDKHRKVDDTPYGGGAGMVMKVEPFDLALKDVKKESKGKNKRVIFMAASGKRFTHADAVRLAAYDQLIFLCGRYEGIDGRVEEHLADESISIGDFVLTGGELPALMMVDAIARQIPGVLGDEGSLKEESHTEEGLLEYPQFTKPEVYKKWQVPEELLSGNHKRIEEWRKKNARRS